MQFLFPEFLFALGLTAVPVILHLLNLRRYKRMDFSDIRFLKELQEKNKRRKSLRDIIILALRVLAITFLVLAFAQPYKPLQSEYGSGKIPWVSIYLDNSFSMQTGNPETLFEKARKQIPALISSYPEGEHFQLLTNDFEGRHQRLMNKKELLQHLDEVKPGPQGRNLREIQNRQLALKNTLGLGPGHAYWLSDFQAGMKAPLVRTDSASRLFLVPLKGNEISNVWIDSAWFPDLFLRKGTGNKIRFRIWNQGSNDFSDQPVVLKIDGVQNALRNISVPAGSRDEFELEFTLDDFRVHGFSLSLTDYPAVFDDVYFLRGKAREFTQILLISDPVPFPELKKVYQLDPFFKLTETRLNQIDYAALGSLDAVILNQPGNIPEGVAGELIRYVEEGGTLLLIPSKEQTSTTSLKDFCKSLGVEIGNYIPQRMGVTHLEINHPLFSGVFTKLPENPKLPVFNGYWELKTGGKIALRFGNDLPALVSQQKKKGVFCLLASGADLASGDLSQNPVFVPLFLNLPMLVRKQLPAAYNLGQLSTIAFDPVSGANLLSLGNSQSEIRLEATVRNGMGLATLPVPPATAGIYELKKEGSPIDLLAFNNPRSESRQGSLNLEEIREQTAAVELNEDLIGFSNKMEAAMKGISYWRWMLVLTLLALAGEMVLLRIWKK